MMQIKVITAYSAGEFEKYVNEFLKKLCDKGIDTDRMYLDYVYENRLFICFIEWEE